MAYEHCVSTYVAYGCRCDGCVAAKAVYDSPELIDELRLTVMYAIEDWEATL